MACGSSGTRLSWTCYELVEVETFRAVDRERLLGNLDDKLTAIKRKELTDFLARLDLAPIDGMVIDRAKSSFAVNLRAVDAMHVATAEILAAVAEGEPLEFWTHDDRQATAALAPASPCAERERREVGGGGTEPAGWGSPGRRPR